MNTTENNKLIAEFMGYDMHTPNGKAFSFRIPDGKTLFTPVENLKYHTSWNWLMPVVEKIEVLGYKFEKNYQRIDKDWQSLIVKGNDILFQEFNKDSLLSTHYVVVEFIKWYNENK